MNVDILETNPDWRWYFLFGGGFLALTVLGWLLFKYGQVSDDPLPNAPPFIYTDEFHRLKDWLSDTLGSVFNDGRRIWRVTYSDRRHPSRPYQYQSRLGSNYRVHFMRVATPALVLCTLSGKVIRRGACWLRNQCTLLANGCHLHTTI